MALVKRLLVRGIRNFGLDEGDEQTIVFKGPLTLIIGENGCGKTTIIECLKYAITGDFPPNSERGQTFVHDLKFSGLKQCNAKVLLEVEDAMGEKVTVNRLIKKEIKNNKVSVSSIDNTVTYGSDTEAKQYSRRGQDANAEMCTVMGVSKAIINNVIFCHQEDSTWPFYNDKELKQRFDAIFGTTEYIKVIEKLVKERKTRQEHLSLCLLNEKTAKTVNDETQKKKDYLSRFGAELQKLESQKIAVENNILPIQDKLKEIHESEMQYSKLYSKKTSVENSLKNLESNKNSIQRKIKNLLSGDISACEQALRVSTDRVEQAQIEKDTIESQWNYLKKHQVEIVKQLDKFKTDVHSIQMEIAQQQEVNANRAECVKQLCTTLEIRTSEDLENNDSQVEMLINQLQTRIKSEEEKVSLINQKMNEVDEKFQKAVDELLVKKTQGRAEIAGLQKTRSSMSRERADLQGKINSIEGSQTQMNNIIEEISRLEKTIKTLKENPIVQQTREKIKTDKEMCETLDRENESLMDKITELSSQAEKVTQVNFKNDELKKNESSLRNLLNKHSENMSLLFGASLESNFKAKIDIKTRALNTEIKEIQDKISKCQSKSAELRTHRKNQHDQLAQKEGELKKMKEEMYQKCEGEEFEQVLAKRKEKYSSAQMEYGVVVSSEAMYNKYIKEVKDKTCCPLCHRDMSCIDREALSKELDEKIHELPQDITTKKRQLKHHEQAYNEIFDLKSVNEQVQRLEEETPKLSEELKKTEQQYKELQSDLEGLNKSLVLPKQNLDIALRMVSDMGQMDNLRLLINKLNTELTNLRSTLPEGYQQVDLTEMKSRRQETQIQLREIRVRIGKTEKDLEEFTKKLNEHQDSRTKLMEKKMTFQDNMSNLPEWKERAQKLQRDIQNTDAELAQLSLQSANVEQNLTAKESEKSAAKEQNNKKFQEAQKRFSQIVDKQRDIQRHTKSLKDFTEKRLIEQLKSLEQHHLKKNQESTDNQAKIDEVYEKFNKLKDEIANHELNHRDLQDNLDLKRTEKDIEKMQQELQKLVSDPSNIDYNELCRQQTKMIEEKGELEAKLGSFSGQIHQLKGRIGEAKTELEQPKYKNAYEDWVKKKQKVAVLKMMMADLETYRKALEYSLTKFHQEKMAQINQYIRALWREIYRGNDIDYIEIRTEEPRVSDSSKFRKYEYRVMQCKHNKEVDMRGRCSAGQKVLASLIIRMALSETFSANCGVMTLDEPTTNLDQQNIGSLCDAISRILSDRKRYGNLLLIIITHDEKFLQTLAPYLEGAYRIARNRDGKSFISNVTN